MAITPGPGYMVDPKNPNAVIPIGSASTINNPNANLIATGSATPSSGTITRTSSTPTPAPVSTPVSTPASYQTPQQIANTVAATGQQPVPQGTPLQGTQPVALPNNGGAAPTTSSQPTTTPTTTPSTTVNVHTAPTSATTTAPGAAGTTASTSANALSMPANGSVVDLLNSAGQDSSFAARQQLAANYGIQGYTGTAAQNTELGQKYIAAHSALTGSATPDTAAAARTEISSHLEENTPKEDPQKTFFDEYMTMNPVVKTLYDQINQALSTPATTETFQQEYKDLISQQGIPALQTDLMNIKNIMDGTEDDIRTEISKSGGFATDSQVMALAGARNKTLLKQANSLQQQLALKEDYVDQIMQFSEKDRAQVDKDLDRKLGLTQKMIDLQESITNAAHDNYQNIVSAVGYQGLADATSSDPTAQRFAEQSLGLPSGSLRNPTFLASQDATADKPFQFISGTENQASGIFNPNTGTFTPRGGGGGGGNSGLGGIGSGTNSDGTPKTPIQRDADSVMSGVLNLQDISTKDNYRAQVSAELNKRFNSALASGDIYGVMKASAAYDKEPGDTFITSMEKLTTTLGQIGVLQENIQGTNTGPITGLFRGNNPWDTNAQSIKAQLNAIVPNLARGVYGEVGVLTDNDIKNYSKTLPNLTSTTDVRNAVLYITVDMIRRNAESKIKNQAAGQRDMSGYADVYQALVDETQKIKSSITGGTKVGTIESNGIKIKVTQLPNGDIVDANGNKYDQQGNKINASSSIPWNSLSLNK